MKTKIIFFFPFLILLQHLSFSQTDSADIYDLSFNQLSKIIITSASKTPQTISEVASTIYVISAAEIKEKAYFTLEDVLSDLPGFQFRNIQGINSYSFQRGIPNQNNLILLLIDGVQINELNSGGYYGGAQYNLSNVERIEVIYGPASVIYGTNAVTGIINIITKNPLEKQLEINTLAGSFNTKNIDFNFCHTNEKKNLGVLISGMCKTSDKADLKGIKGDYNWTDLMDNFENDYALDVKVQANNFTLGANFIQKETSTATLMKSVGTIYKDYGTSWNIRFINNYLKYQKKITDKLSLFSTLYNRNATVLDNTIYRVVDTAQIGYYRPNNLSGVENILSYNLLKNISITGGLIAEFEQLSQKYSLTNSDSFNIKPPTPKKTPMEDNYLISAYLEPQFTFFNSLYLSGGVRFDQSSIYEQITTPRAGLSYNFKKQIVRLSYAEAFRAPKPWDYTDGLGNGSLLPEKMKSIEAAIALTFSDNYKADLIGFKNDLDNAINKEIIGDDYRWINTGQINTDGIDVYLHYISNKFKSSISYSFTNSVNENKVIIPEISKHSGNASITYAFNNHLKINLRANYIGKRKNPHLIETTNSKYIDPCLIFFGTLSMLNYKNINLQISVRNILNTEYYHTSNRDIDRYRQSQRTVLLSLGYAIKN